MVEKEDHMRVEGFSRMGYLETGLKKYK